METAILDILLDKGVLIALLAFMVFTERRERKEVQGKLDDCQNRRAAETKE